MIQWNVVVWLMVVSWALIGEMSQFMRPLSENSLVFAGESFRLAKKRARRRKRFKLLLVLTYWDILVIFSHLSKTVTFMTRVFCSRKTR